MTRFFPLILLPLLGAQLSAASPGASASLPHVYVWDFATRDLKKDHLTAKFTHDFELALVQYGQSRFRVLERRNLAGLIAQRDNERAVHDVLGISASTLRNLKARAADLVIFGEVFDDFDSGEIVVTVTFQAFDGAKTAMASTKLSRGLVNDATSRMGAMKRLVEGLQSGAPLGKTALPLPKDPYEETTTDLPEIDWGPLLRSFRITRKPIAGPYKTRVSETEQAQSYGITLEVEAKQSFSVTTPIYPVRLYDQQGLKLRYDSVLIVDRLQCRAGERMTAFIDLSRPVSELSKIVVEDVPSGGLPF